LPQSKKFRILPSKRKARAEQTISPKKKNLRFLKKWEKGKGKRETG